MALGPSHGRCNVHPETSLPLPPSPDEVDDKEGGVISSYGKCQARQILTTKIAAGVLQKHDPGLENEMKEILKNEIVSKTTTLATSCGSESAVLEEQLLMQSKLSPAPSTAPQDELSPILSTSTTHTLQLPLTSSPPRRHYCNVHPEVTLSTNNDKGEKPGGKNSSCHKCQSYHILLLKMATWALQKRAEKMVNKNIDNPKARESKGKDGDVDKLALLEEEGKDKEEADQQTSPLGRKSEINKAVGRMKLMVTFQKRAAKMAKENKSKDEDVNKLSLLKEKEKRKKEEVEQQPHLCHGPIANGDSAGGRRHRYSIGQRARRSEMDVTSEDALVRIARLREGDGAWVKRRRRSDGWTYAILKERHAEHLVFTVNERGSKKILPISTWAKFIRIVASQEKFYDDQFGAIQETQHEDKTVSMDRTRVPIGSYPATKRAMRMRHLKEGAHHLGVDEDPTSTVLDNSLTSRGSGRKENKEDKIEPQLVLIEDHEVSMYTLGLESPSHAPTVIKVLEDNELSMFTFSEEGGILLPSNSFHDSVITVTKKGNMFPRCMSFPTMPLEPAISHMTPSNYITTCDTDEEEISKLNGSATTLKRSNSRPQENETIVKCKYPHDGSLPKQCCRTRPSRPIHRRASCA